MQHIFVITLIIAICLSICDVVARPHSKREIRVKTRLRNSNKGVYRVPWQMRHSSRPIVSLQVTYKTRPTMSTKFHKVYTPTGYQQTSQLTSKLTTMETTTVFYDDELVDDMDLDNFQKMKGKKVDKLVKFRQEIDYFMGLPALPNWLEMIPQLPDPNWRPALQYSPAYSPHTNPTGYYADQLSVGQEVRGNSTVRVKNESRGFHLNNLSYAGPIVMGVGGFIVVAACVMTFEARDSAAKVVPARFKFNNNQKPSPVPSKHTPLPPSRADSGRRTTSSQTKWDNHLGLFRVPSNTQPSPSGSDTLGRHALTAAFVQFSRALHQRQISVESSNSHKRLGSQPMVTGITKSPSAPNLPLEIGTGSPQPTPAAKPQSHLSPKVRPKPSCHTLHPMGGGCALLSPFLLQRQALSMDNPAYSGCYSPPLLLHRQASGRSAHSGGSRESLELGASAGASGSQTSMAMDLHLPNDCPVTLRVTDQSRRSETARRHLFVRQNPVEEDEVSGGEHRSPHSCSPRLSGYITRSNTNDSNVTYPRSRSNTGESRHHYYGRRDSLTRGISYMRSSTDESRIPYPRSRANTGESQRYQYRKDSVNRGSAKLYHSRSMADDSRHRRESLAGEFNRRRRESLTKPYYPRSNGDECKYHSLSPLSYDSRSPVSISRSNTDESSHRQDSSAHEYELAYVRTSNEDFTPQDSKDKGNSRTASPSNIDQTDLSNINDVILEKDTPTDSFENGSLDHPEDLIKDTVRSETVIIELSETEN